MNEPLIQVPIIPPELRPYQVKAIEALRQAVRDGHKRIILNSPTGSGKTLTAAEIIRGAVAKNRKVAFLANRIHLVAQTARVLNGYGIECGIIQGANTKAPWSSVLVCSIQTVARRGLPEVDLIVIDEVHGAAGTKGYHELMNLGTPVLGLTATPYSVGLGKHYDSLGGPLFEKVVTAAKIMDLIRDGFLVSAEIWAPGEPDLSKVKIVAGDYDEKQLGEAVDKAELIGDIVSHWIKLANNESTVVFATNIAHSKHICEQFLSVGVKAEHLDAYTPEDDRIAILERVQSGDTKIICNVGVLCEGWDFPACKVLILARPTKSLIRYLQMAGRILRPYPGKSAGIILDHAGCVRRLGFPWDDFDQPLDDGKPKSSKAKKERTEPLPKPCPQCHFMKPPRTPICPMCNFESKAHSEIETADGELVQLTGKERKPKTLALSVLGKQTVYGQLLDHAQSHGYSSGWVAHKYKEVFGVWPRGMVDHAEPVSLEVANWIRSQNIRWHKSKARERVS